MPKSKSSDPQHLYLVAVAVISFVALVLSILSFTGFRATGEAFYLTSPQYQTQPAYDTSLIPSEVGYVEVICRSNSDCSTNQVCGVSDEGTRVCEGINSNNLGDRCVRDDECKSELCGPSNEGVYVCESPNSNFEGDLCKDNRECGIGLNCDTGGAFGVAGGGCF